MNLPRFVIFSNPKISLKKLYKSKEDEKPLTKWRATTNVKLGGGLDPFQGFGFFNCKQEDEEGQNVNA